MVDKTKISLTRRRLQWSQYQIGKYLGISRHVILKLEQGLDVDVKGEKRVNERLEVLYEAAHNDLSAIPKPAKYMRNLSDIQAAVNGVCERIAV